jgi:hypothetical protein
LEQHNATDPVSADSLDLRVMLGKHRTREFGDVARMPDDSAPIAARRGKPGDLGEPIADGDQMHPTAFAAMRAGPRDLLERQSTTRRTRSRFFLNLPFAGMEMVSTVVK